MSTRPTLTVMISSTARDLPEHRKQVMDACLAQDMFPKMMEHLPASDADAIAASLRMVDEADVYLGVFAWRYGYVPKGYDISITEMEYNRAVERGMPRLLFFMHDDHPVKGTDVEKGPGAAKLEAFKQRLAVERVANFFKSPEDLRAQVINSLSKLHPAAASPEPLTRADLLTYAANVQAAYAHWADQPEQPAPPLYDQPPPPANADLPARPPDAYISVLGQALPMRVSEFRALPTGAPPPQQELTAVLRGARRSILVGEPGSGKTAALERLAWLLATAALAAADGEALLLPILAPLSRYAGEADLLPLVTASFNRHAAAALDADAMRQMLQDSAVGFVLLLDGLNELGGRSADGVKALHATLERHPHLPVHVTVRTADFDPDAELDPDQAVLPGAQQWSVLPLADDIQYWGDDDPARPSDVRRYLHKHLPEAAAKKLWERIHADERLRTLARNPLLLYMLKEVGGETGGELPADRGALLQKFVRSSRLLGQVSPKDLRERAERCLEALGWRLQEQRALETDVDGFTAAISGVAGVDAAAMRVQLRQCRLLLDDGSRLRFLHQLVQEYGAAAHLARRRDGGAALRQVAADEWWRETAILALWLDRSLHTPDYLMGLMGAPAVDLRVRVAAATILGQVGDPRFPVQTATVVGRDGARRPVRCIEPAMVEIAGGLAQLGGDDPEADDDEKPGCTVPVSAFALAVYPVTNAEFRLLPGRRRLRGREPVDAGGPGVAARGRQAG